MLRALRPRPGPLTPATRAKLHAHDTASCRADGRLQIAPADMRDILATSFAELPGLLTAAALADLLGRKRWAPARA